MAHDGILLRRQLNEILEGHECTEASFIVKCSTDTRMSRCLLCNTGYMTKTCRNAHLKGQNHTRRHARLKELLDARRRSHRVDRANQLTCRVAALGSLKWRQNVQVLLLEYIQNDDSHFTSPFVAEQALAKYEMMERLSLLELAVWKASLDNDPFFSTMEDLDAYWTLDTKFDPVAYKNDRRVTSGITAIIQGVLPFLSDSK